MKFQGIINRGYVYGLLAYIYDIYSIYGMLACVLAVGLLFEICFADLIMVGIPAIAQVLGNRHATHVRLRTNAP